MNSPSGTCPLDVEAAGNVLDRMLVGAYLDQISAYSLQACLRFMSDRMRYGTINFVDVTLTCDAVVAVAVAVAENNNLLDYIVEDDFFSSRARFLAGVHGLIGKNVSGVRLQPNGRLAIDIESSSVILCVTSDDYEEDDWIWKVESEATIDEPRVGIRSLLCIPTDERVSFVAAIEK